MQPQDVLTFWFEEIDAKLRFAKDLALDQRIRERFGALHREIMEEKTADWRRSPTGRLAEIIVLDQFSRNMFRGTAQAFASDEYALKLAQAAVAAGDDLKVTVDQRAFVYMPYMHSEDRAIHEQAMTLFSQKGLEYSLKFEIMHKKIIDRFGRYPHRNEILGRTSTAEEIEFLKEDGSSF